jgi:hypothetical protein
LTRITPDHQEATDFDLQMGAAALWQLTYNQTCQAKVRGY